MKRISISCIWILLALLGMAAWAYAEATDEFNKTYPISAGTTVNISNVNGKVTVSTWDQSNAEIRAIKKTKDGKSDLDAVKIEITPGANTLDIKTIHPKKRSSEDESFLTRISRGFRHYGSGVTVDYTITLPKTAMLGKVSTVNGNVELTEISGPTVARSTNGNVKVDKAQGISEAHSVNGNIEIRDTRGNIDIHTTNGSIRAENIDGALSSRSVNGNVHLNGVSIIREARTTNGSIEAGITGTAPEAMEISTVNGSVRFSFPQNMNAEMDIQSSHGKISAPGGLTINMENISPRHMTGKLGAGGNKIHVKTVNGSIVLNKM
jgi:DUF4097 and DUF4098 domain-containing protein YvlB